MPKFILIFATLMMFIALSTLAQAQTTTANSTKPLPAQAPTTTANGSKPLPCDGELEFVDGADCRCIEGYERIGVSGDPCVPECAEGEVRDFDNYLCVPSAMCEAVCKKATPDRDEFREMFGDVDHFWLLLASLLVGIANLGVLIYILRCNRKIKAGSPPPPSAQTARNNGSKAKVKRPSTPPPPKPKAL